MNEPNSGSVESSPNSSKLPDKPSAEFLRKLAKDRLKELRQSRPDARLFEAQLQIARQYGFGSWREMAALLNAGQRGKVCRENGRVEIEGIAPLLWSDNKWCTYLAAMANVLGVIGPAHDYVRLLGDSGLAFRLRFFTNDANTVACPSSPIGEMPPWTDFTERSVGWKMRYQVRLKDTADDPADMSDLLDEITASIDSGLPVLGYFKTMDVGIAYGYEGSKLLIRDFHAGNTEASIEISQCRGLITFFEQRMPVPARETSARSAIAEAVSRWSHAPDPRALGGETCHYYYGADAYDRWTTLLDRVQTLTAEQQKPLLHVDHWTFNQLHDARSKAGSYLRSITDLFPQSAESLNKAADFYRQMGEITGEVLREEKIFPAFYKPGALERWTKDVRQTEIDVLNQLRRLDQQAIASLRRAS